MTPRSLLAWPSTLSWEKYLRPRTLPEALGWLEEFGSEAAILAGGTDLIVQIRRKETSPKVLIDITRIPGLDEIQLEQGFIKIGPLVTHRQAAESSLLREKGFALSEGASQVGSPQIRNLGTIAGNIVSGQPAADTALPLLAMDASVKLISTKGERTLPLTKFFVATGETALDRTREIVKEISFPPLGKEETSVYLRLARRRALALPILAICVVLSADLKNKRFLRVRISLGPVAPTPIRATDAESALTEAPLTDEVIKGAAQRAARESNPRTSLVRGSREYRQAMVANLVERGILTALERLEVSSG